MTKENKKEEKAQKKAEEDWMTKKWRPMMAMMYMTCCLFDFALFPIMFTVVQFWEVQAANDAFRQWVPITLQGGGLFHVAMGGVLGVSAYGRTQEKVAGASNVSTGLPTSGVPTPSLSSATPAFSGGGFSTPAPVASTGFTPAPSQGFATEPAAPSFNSAPTAPGGRRPVTPGFNV
ncbi:Holin of 3TMs, for gene-transfer release [uncultured Caudovirales phage]|uniref:Holin of 3TMs, for gene-transfer release n=1 Tax=uncultured Caudovirales phage TaxID=2100421 RepID=A0A6J7WUU9_9CAUD|nr:Holin of 3TMs, for gene-transfer release [uncultured Caudovirales phage]